MLQSGAHRGHRVHVGSRGFKRARLEIVGFTWVRVLSLGAPTCRRDNSSLRSFTRASLEIAGFIRVRVGPLGGSPCSVVFVWVHSGALRGCIRVSICRAKVSRVHSSSREFNRLRKGVAGLIPVRVSSLECA